MNWTLQVEENRLEDVVNVDQLKQRLLQLHEQAKAAPCFAVLNAPDGSSLAVGLGRELSVLSYSAPGGWPARHVRGSETNEGLLDYTYFGHFSEMPARYAVPFVDALNVAIEFFNSGRLSEDQQWEDD